MDINIDACRTAINAVKGKIDNCFTACNNKGSTYSQTSNTLDELLHKINGIPTGSGDSGSGGTVTGIGQPFNGFGVTSNGDSVTLNCGSIGASWRGISVYSNTKRGFYSIYKVDSSRCIVSGMPWYYYDDGSTVGEFPYSLESSSCMCNYSVSGSSITLTVIVYSVERPADISMMANQVNSDSNYLLDLIDVF